MMDSKLITKLLHLKRAKLTGHNLMASCPWAKDFHRGEDKHASFGINLNTGKWQCFTCGDQGQKGVSLDSLAVRLGVKLPSEFAKKVRQSSIVALRDVLGGTKKDVPQHLKNILISNKSYAFDYLKDRGVTKKAVTDAFVGRHLQLGTLFFLDIDDKGVLRGWVERNEQWSGRYGFGGGFRKELLFGLTSAMETCYLVEGPVDKLKIDSFLGVPSAVATFGNMIFEEQAERILRLCKKLVLVPDQDAAGERWLADARRRFLGKIKTWRVDISKYKDAGDANYNITLFQRDVRRHTFMW